LTPGPHDQSLGGRRPLADAIVWLGIAALAAVGLVATWDAWTDILRIAMTDEEQSHIILVPIVVAWMVWVRRGRLRRFRPWGTLIGPVCVAIGWLLSRVGYFNSLQSLWHAGAIVVVMGTLLTGLGLNFFLRFFPAFAVLVFLVPVPGMVRHQVSGPLQTASAAVTQAMLETFGVPVERSMNLLSLNGHEIAVAEACNGMRMVLALVLVSYAFAFGLPLRAPARILVMIASPLAALVCNILRLIPTVLMYGYADTKLADAFHSVSGWLMVPLAFIMLLGTTHLLRWALIPVTRFNLAYQ
jgi:exosortase